MDSAYVCRALGRKPTPPFKLPLAFSSNNYIAKSMGTSNSSLAHILKEVCLENKNKFEKMTEREKEIMGLIVNGFNSEAMAIMLGISKNTINTHRKNINKKTKLKSPKELVLFALAFDLL